MSDESLMKPPVSTFDGSRFLAAPISADSLASGHPVVPSHTASRPSVSRFSVSQPEESFVEDDRSHLSPAQVVESRLMSRLKESSLPVSHLQMRGLVRARYEA